jgi:ribonuclease P/MRP protein subunit POP5
MVRFKNRWLLVELIPAPGNVVSLNQELGKMRAGINGKDIWNALKQSVILNFGDTGWGEVGYSLTGSFRLP